MYLNGEHLCGCADKKWGQAYLTREFFQLLGEAMPEQVLLVMAEEGGRPVAGALNLIGSHALFGRNWGCAYGREIKHLHFEVCYYQVPRACPLLLYMEMLREEDGCLASGRSHTSPQQRCKWVRHL